MIYICKGKKTNLIECLSPCYYSCEYGKPARCIVGRVVDRKSAWRKTTKFKIIKTRSPKEE